MARYQFYKANIADTGLLDIRGTHYRRLLQACFRYSASVAVCMPVDANIDTQRIATFRRKVTPQIRMQYAHIGNFTEEDTDQTNTYQLVRYLLVPAVKSFIMNRTESIFAWSKEKGNPEDLTFFRPDGTVFFSVRTHDGVCTLNPEEDEDVSRILSDTRWREM